jgi:pilus assembly protein Flp/PilA
MRAFRILQRLLGDCRGATAVEYGLIVSLVVIAVIVSMQGVADANTGLWATVRDKVTASTGG